MHEQIAVVAPLVLQESIKVSRSLEALSEQPDIVVAAARSKARVYGFMLVGDLAVLRIMEFAGIRAFPAIEEADTT